MKAKKGRAKSSKAGRATKKQVLFFSSQAEAAMTAATSRGRNTVNFEALTGKTVRATSARVLGNAGSQTILGSVNLNRISIPVSAKEIKLTGNKSLANVHKWHKGTEYDEQNTRPFRAQLLKNGKFMLDDRDATRFAHYLSTGGNRDSIRITYNDVKMTSKKMQEVQARREAGLITNKRYKEFEKKYTDQMQIRALTRELQGNRETVPTRYGGTTGNRTGVTRRSVAASRSKRTGVYNPRTTTGTRKYKVGRKSTQSAASKAKAAKTVYVAANERARVAQRRLSRNRK